ncbi:MAG: GTPase Era [Bacteroidales bacterium]|nr:GTPase Era [Bacteroidales bacterium]HOY37940.1 GTPase Era [Bacteroidales bacterium]HQP03525.1 GTPase Era [Bacteroidales bacterium]
MHRSGFVNIIGNPNVGKSTLMNCMVGERISIITSKSQTTRHRILGIVNGDDFQIVYSDTPGIIRPNYRMQERMMSFVSTAISDADIIIYVTDILDKSEKNSEFVERVKSAQIPVIVVVNKVDLVSPAETDSVIAEWKSVFPERDVVAVSALTGYQVDLLFQKIRDLLPEGPKWFPDDQLTDKTERFIVSEIIREKILLNYKKEIPYSVEVEIESFKETEKIINISAVINVARESQKGIVIGHKGEALKKVGTAARIDTETFFGKPVFLEMFVRVKKDWRNSDRMLDSFGYR